MKLGRKTSELSHDKSAGGRGAEHGRDNGLKRRQVLSWAVTPVTPHV
jgi:hypothetical protein